MDKPISDLTDGELDQSLQELTTKLEPLQHEHNRREIQKDYQKTAEYLKSRGWEYITGIPNRYIESFWYKVSECGIRFGYISRDGFIGLPNSLSETNMDGIPTPIVTYFFNQFLKQYQITITPKEII